MVGNFKVLLLKHFIKLAWALFLATGNWLDWQRLVRLATRGGCLGNIRNAMVEDLAVPGHHTTGFIVFKMLLDECSKPKRNNTGRLALRGMRVSVVLIL